MRGELVGVCSCGRQLYACLNEHGKRIGVTHTPEDEDWHLEYWGGMRVDFSASKPKMKCDECGHEWEIPSLEKQTAPQEVACPECKQLYDVTVLELGDTNYNIKKRSS